MSTMATVLFGFVCMLIIACMILAKAAVDDDDWPSGA